MSQNQTKDLQDLGVLLYRHTSSKTNRFSYTLFMIAIAIIFYFVLVGTLSSAENSDVLSGLLFALMLLAIYLVIGSFLVFYLKCELCLYEFGAVEQFGIWKYSARYEDITVWHSSVGFSSISPKLNNHGYAVKFPDSSCHNMFYMDFRFNEVANHLMELVHQAKMPNIMLNFNSGNDINFGRVTINKKEIRVDSQEFLWDEGYYLILNRGVFTIKRHGMSRWDTPTTIDYPTIPDVLAFQDLLRRMSKL
jgi:hypothetical protein